MSLPSDVSTVSLEFSKALPFLNHVTFGNGSPLIEQTTENDRPAVIMMCLSMGSVMKGAFSGTETNKK